MDNCKEKEFKLAFIKPNNKNYSETFLENQIRLLSGWKMILYGGSFPTRLENGNFLINNPFHFLWYWGQKNIYKQSQIPIRNKYLENCLKENKITIVLAQYGPTGALIMDACKNAKIPLVIHFHGYDAYDQETLRRFKTLYPKAFEYAYKMVAVSQDMVFQLIQLGAKPEKISLIPYGVDMEYFTKVEPIKSDISFLSVARFAEKKSPLSTLQAFNKVVIKFPQARLIMAGIGPLWEEAKRMAQTLGLTKNIDFKGVQTPDEIKLLMAKSRAFVQHSVTAPGGDKEGTPNSILEASAAGLPIISTFHAGIPEAVLDGLSGYLVKEHDIEAMAVYMMELAQNPQLAEEMGNKGREHIYKNYNIKDQINKLDSLLRNASFQPPL